MMMVMTGDNATTMMVMTLFNLRFDNYSISVNMIFLC